MGVILFYEMESNQPHPASGRIGKPKVSQTGVGVRRGSSERAGHLTASETFTPTISTNKKKHP